MTPEARSTFLKAYGQVLTRTWEDEAYSNRVLSDPAGALKEAGLTVPPGVTLQATRDLPLTREGKQGTVVDLVNQWEKEVASGSATLYLPAKPALAESELSEEQLSAVAGGTCCSSIISCCCCC
jgi:hypothetical protein